MVVKNLGELYSIGFTVPSGGTLKIDDGDYYFNLVKSLVKSGRFKDITPPDEDTPGDWIITDSPAGTFFLRTSETTDFIAFPDSGIYVITLNIVGNSKTTTSAVKLKSSCIVRVATPNQLDESNISNVNQTILNSLGSEFYTSPDIEINPEGSGLRVKITSTEDSSWSLFIQKELVSKL